jgi:hypothetical protein
MLSVGEGEPEGEDAEEGEGVGIEDEDGVTGRMELAGGERADGRTERRTRSGGNTWRSAGGVAA